MPNLGGEVVLDGKVGNLILGKEIDCFTFNGLTIQMKTKFISEDYFKINLRIYIYCEIKCLT